MQQRTGLLEDASTDAVALKRTQISQISALEHRVISRSYAYFSQPSFALLGGPVWAASAAAGSAATTESSLRCCAARAEQPPGYRQLTATRDAGWRTDAFMQTAGRATAPDEARYHLPWAVSRRRV